MMSSSATPPAAAPAIAAMFVEGDGLLWAGSAVGVDVDVDIVVKVDVNVADEVDVDTVLVTVPVLVAVIAPKSLRNNEFTAGSLLRTPGTRSFAGQNP
jgi:hypothetical protein